VKNCIIDYSSDVLAHLKGWRYGKTPNWLIAQTDPDKRTHSIAITTVRDFVVCA